MSQKIQHRRGLKKDLPDLEVAEIGITTDTKEVFFGTDEGNHQVALVEDIPSIEGLETVSGAQEKADTAENNAKVYADEQIALIPDASTTKKGHMQVGDGLAVNNGVVSTGSHLINSIGVIDAEPDDFSIFPNEGIYVGLVSSENRKAWRDAMGASIFSDANLQYSVFKVMTMIRGTSFYQEAHVWTRFTSGGVAYAGNRASYKREGQTTYMPRDWQRIITKDNDPVWRNVTGQNGFLNSEASYFKNELNEVHLNLSRGPSSAEIGGFTELFTLPEAYRPMQDNIDTPVRSGTKGIVGYLTINGPTGIVRFYSHGGSTDKHKEMNAYVIFRAGDAA